MSEIDDQLTRYLIERDSQRDERVNHVFGSLSDRERALVREAAVMGYVQGVQAARAGDISIPKDLAVVWRVIDACQTHGDLYPTLSMTDMSEETTDDD